MGSVGVGPKHTTVALTFNKSLDQNTVNNSNFALYQGPNNMGANVSISADRCTVYLSLTLPFSATITATANTNVKDYAGKSMASPSATFSTEAQPWKFNPSVIQTRPGNGAPLNNPITLYTNSQIDLSSAQNGVFVAQNGALIPVRSRSPRTCTGSSYPGRQLPGQRLHRGLGHLRHHGPEPQPDKQRLLRVHHPGL